MDELELSYKHDMVTFHYAALSFKDLNKQCTDTSWKVLTKNGCMQMMVVQLLIQTSNPGSIVFL